MCHILIGFIVNRNKFSYRLCLFYIYLWYIDIPFLCWNKDFQILRCWRDDRLIWKHRCAKYRWFFRRKPFLWSNVISLFYFQCSLSALWQQSVVVSHITSLAEVTSCYLRQGGYVFIGVRLFVCLFVWLVGWLVGWLVVRRMTQTPLNRYSHNSV